jgi:hypothetical protein
MRYPIHHMPPNRNRIKENGKVPDMKVEERQIPIRIKKPRVYTNCGMDTHALFFISLYPQIVSAD